MKIKPKEPKWEPPMKPKKEKPVAGIVIAMLFGIIVFMFIVMISGCISVRFTKPKCSSCNYNGTR